MNRTKIAINP